MALRFGSLFTGIGGFDLGFERAGMVPAWQCEIDTHARAVLARHWPDVRIVDDVRLVGTHHPFDMCPPEREEGCERDIECIGISELGDDPIDVLAGGFPCQDISAARDRWGASGIEGKRSGLWWEFARVIDVARPEWVVIENTGRLRNGRGGSDIRAVVGELDRLAYVGVGLVLDAAAFGSAAGRPRVVLVARDSRRDGSLSGPERLAAHFLRNDPGFVVLERAGQPLATDNGVARPSAGSYRKLTPTECERLQGFPDGWTEGQADSHRYRQLGNAVAVPVAEWIGRRIVEVSRLPWGKPSDG